MSDDASAGQKADSVRTRDASGGQDGREGLIIAAHASEAPAAPGVREVADLDIEALFRDYHAMVFRAAYRVTGSAADAEDVLQTVFLRLVRRASDSEPTVNVESYLRRAAVNAAVDLLRSRQVIRAVSLDDVEPRELKQDDVASPERAQSSAELRDWLRRTIATLSPRAAEIFTLRFFEGKANPEIAEMLGTTTSTVAVTLHRTKERIQNEYRALMGEGK